MAHDGRYTWMRLSTAQFLADTLGLSDAERGAYISLVCRAWELGGKLPYTGITALSALTGAKAQNITSAIKKLSQINIITVEDGYLHIQMVDTDIARTQKLATLNAEKGRRSGEARRLRVIEGGE